MLRWTLSCAALLAAIGGIVRAQTVPAGFQVDTILTLSGADTTAHVFCYLPGGDNRIVIASRAGLLTVFTTDAAVPSSAAIGAIPGVKTTNEQGVLGLAADPAWPQRPYVYAWYPAVGTSFIRLSRFELAGDLTNASSTNLALVAGSEHQVLADVPDNVLVHNGGELEFGPDGMLYAALGDDFDFCNSQDRTQLKGKILRLDVSSLPAGAGGPAAKSALAPGDNPYDASPNANERLIVAYGLRNPVSFSIDPVAGDLFIADVGHFAREELDHWPRNLGSAPAGLNYGWPWREGVSAGPGCSGTAPGGLTGPLDDYDHASGGISIMAGGFITSSPTQQFQWPAAFDRNVFHNDYFNGGLARLTPNGTSWTRQTGFWGTGFMHCLRFKQDPRNGDLKFLKHAGAYATNGVSLMRLRPSTPLNQVLVDSGAGQVANAGETFAAPLRVRALTPQGQALAGWPVTFTSMAGAVAFASSMPISTDAQGYAQTFVVAGANPGVVSVRATTQGGDVGGATIGLYQRGIKITLVQGTPTDTLVLAVTNAPSGMPSPVSYAMMLGFAQPPLTTPFGTLCVNPFDAANTLVFEDGFNAFSGFVVKGAIGTPSKTNVYTGLSQALAGLGVSFQVFGYTPGFATGDWWISNCVPVTF
jgi:glucose/arabinose dehydrogenase